MSKLDPILPGATLGMLGGGQLGRMFTLAARQMGYRVSVLTPEGDSPTGQIAHQEHCAPYDDVDAVSRFAEQVAVVTFEFENVPAETVAVPGVWVEDVRGDRLPTLPNLTGYLRDLEYYIAAKPGVRFVNATRGGARIRGAETAGEVSLGQ